MSKNQQEHGGKHQRQGGKSGRGWGGKLKPHELARELSPSTQTRTRPHVKEPVPAVQVIDEAELHERLAAFHHSYFKTKKDAPITFRSIGMNNIEELSAAFAQYDAIRSRKRSQGSQQLMAIISSLLGLNSKKETARWETQRT